MVMVGLDVAILGKLRCLLVVVQLLAFSLLLTSTPPSLVFIATVVVAPPVAPPVALPVVPPPVLPPRAALNNVPPFPVVHRAILAAVAHTPTLVVELVLAAIKRYPCPSKSNDSI